MLKYAYFPQTYDTFNTYETTTGRLIYGLVRQGVRTVRCIAPALY